MSWAVKPKVGPAKALPTAEERRLATHAHNADKLAEENKAMKEKLGKVGPVTQVALDDDVEKARHDREAKTKADKAKREAEIGAANKKRAEVLKKQTAAIASTLDDSTEKRRETLGLKSGPAVWKADKA
ncbi:hypothetical protein FOA52_015545 [Chlamydomonas sp. UWO 241]|nr:hypothetical protein FOA52_015545 [Chlamydomonas sp. UWO 241]